GDVVQSDIAAVSLDHQPGALAFDDGVTGSDTGDRDANGTFGIGSDQQPFPEQNDRFDARLVCDRLQNERRLCAYGMVVITGIADGRPGDLGPTRHNDLRRRAKPALRAAFRKLSTNPLARSARSVKMLPF